MWIDDAFDVFPGECRDSCTTCNLGAASAFHGSAIDGRYIGADIDASDSLISFSTESRADDCVLISIKRAL